MKPRFIADGELRLEQSEEFHARLRDRIYEKYAAELSTAGLVRRCVLHWRIFVEYRRERQRIAPSSQSLYSSGIDWRAFSRNNSVAKNTRPHPCPTAVELRKWASETEAVFSLSSDEGGGEGRGEELGFIGFPLSPSLSPLVPRGARECMRKVHSNLNSTAVHPCPLAQGEGETFAGPLVKRPSSVVLCVRSERRRSGDCNRSVRIFQRCASALSHPQGEGESPPFLGKADALLKRSPSDGDYKRDFGTFENCTNAVPSPGGDG